MVNPNDVDPEGKDSDGQKSQNFKKSDFTIAMDSMGNGFEMFIQKSADVLFDWVKNIKKFFTPKKKKDKTGKPIRIRKETPAERQYKLSQKIYDENKKLEEQLEKIDASLSKTKELASQIKEDTTKIKLDIEAVSVILEYQMDRIDDVEEYMKENLGTDWVQIKNFWSMYKEGEMTRGEFTKAALKKLGKNFLGIFVNTVA